MLNSYSQLREDLDHLRSYAGFLAEAVALSKLCVPRRLKMAEHLAPLQRARAKLRSASLSQHNYSSLIVALYGAIERFGEASIAEYVALLNHACPRYAELPEALQKAHVAATWRILQDPDRSRLGPVDELVADLHSCLQNQQPYRITAAAFWYHTANFRHGLFHELWKVLGVADMTSAIQSAEAYRSAVDKVDPGQSERSFYRFDNIADRRNEVAHGSAPVDLLSTALFLQYVDIVEAFAGALIDRIYSAALELAALHHGSEYGSPIAVHNNRIACFECSGRLAIGDFLVARLPNGRFRGGPIKSIQIENEQRNKIDGTGVGVSVGVEVGFRVKDTHLLSVVPGLSPGGEAVRRLALP